jgi:HPt (histidine-containing phosphotransfer) domain-containing protein
MTEDLKAMDAELALLEKNLDDAAARERLEALVHDLKGNAGSFDFRLVAMVADCFQTLLSSLEQIDRTILAVIRDHRHTLEIAMEPSLSDAEKKNFQEFMTLSRQLVERLGKA